MSRLTMQEVIEHCERTVNAYNRKTILNNIETKRCWEHKQTAEWLKELQHYKDLEEQDRLIDIPFPLGTKEVFYADEEDCEVYVLNYHLNVIRETDEIVYIIDSFNFTKEEASTLLFATEEEAEAKLAELKGE